MVTVLQTLEAAPPIVSLDISDDLKQVSLQGYNRSIYGVCLYKRPSRYVSITYLDGGRLKSQGIIGRPPVSDEEYEECPIFIAPGEFWGRSWAIDYFYPRIEPRPFRICYEFNWMTFGGRGDSGHSEACSIVRPVADGRPKVLQQPSKAWYYSVSKKRWTPSAPPHLR